MLFFRCTLGLMYSHLFISETEYIPMVINCMGKHLEFTRCFLYVKIKEQQYIIHYSPILIHPDIAGTCILLEITLIFIKM
jgi:hypothetical protein